MQRSTRDSKKVRRPAHSFPRTKEEYDEVNEIFGVTDSEEEEADELDECKHEETVYKNGVQVCQECGKHVYEEMIQEQEWRYYGNSDNKNASDPSRCQYRMQAEKGVSEASESTKSTSRRSTLYQKY
jgi:hypothetical protein